MVPPPKYARYSPDTPSDESSEEELPNFTLLSEESILPEGSKRTRTQKVPLIFDDAPLSPPRRPRRVRSERHASDSLDTYGKEPAQDEPTSEVLTFPMRRSRDVSTIPRKFKRRRIVDESPSPDSGIESGVHAFSGDVDDEEEEPIRPMPSRRSAKLSVATIETLVVPDSLGIRDLSSDLSSPPDSDVDGEQLQTHGMLEHCKDTATATPSMFFEDQEANNGTSEERIAPTDDGHERQQTKAQTTDSVLSAESQSAFPPTPTTDIEVSQRSLKSMTLTNPIKASNVQDIATEETPGIPDHARQSVMKSDPRKYQEDISRAKQKHSETKIELSSGLASDKSVLRKKHSVPKKKVVTTPQSSFFPQTRPLLPRVKSPPSAPESFRTEQYVIPPTTHPISELPKRVKEVSGVIRPTPTPSPRVGTRPALQVLSSATRPASTGVLPTTKAAAKPMQSPRTHTRHRSMDIASLLNNDEPPPQPSTLRSLQMFQIPEPLQLLVPQHQQMSQFPLATESFLRSLPTPAESFIRSSSAPHRTAPLLDPDDEISARKTDIKSTTSPAHLESDVSINSSSSAR